MMDAIKEELASLVFNVEITIEGEGSQIHAKGLQEKPAQVAPLKYSSADENGVVVKNEVTRNAPCPCGSGKKYKRCHGAA
jgi:preprotein translocase subunit SecA